MEDMNQSSVKVTGRFNIKGGYPNGQPPFIMSFFPVHRYISKIADINCDKEKSYLLQKIAFMMPMTLSVQLLLKQ